MNKIRFLTLCAGLVLGASALTLPLAAKENAEAPVPPGSIQPKGHMKKTDLPAIAKISFEQALQSALAAAPGGVIKAELEIEDGSLLYSFEIVGNDKSITEVEVDAGNGSILATDHENASRDENGGHRHHHKSEDKEDRDND